MSAGAPPDADPSVGTVEAAEPAPRPAPPTVLIGRYAEVALKGANRPRFERALAQRARHLLPPRADVEVRGGRLVVRLPAGASAAASLAALRRCFGLVSVELAVRLPRTVEEDGLAEACLSFAARAMAAGARSFKIAARRADKSYPLNSLELARRLGARVAAAGLRVDVHTPDLVIGVDVRREAVYVSGGAAAGPGGLPTGTAGRALLLLSGGIDSPVAGYLAAKRGLRLSAVYFHTFPYTGDGARMKVMDLAAALSAYTGELLIWVGAFTAAQIAIQAAVPEPMRTVVVRRMMVRIAEALCRREHAGALVTGDSLGQVASQTLESLGAVGAVATFPLLRPLVTSDKTEIVALARRIGTYDISIRPFDDCCTLFAPRHPRTAPTLQQAEDAEAGLDVPALVAQAVGESERFTVTPEGVLPSTPAAAGPGPGGGPGEGGGFPA